jgi:hypothetical protein
MDNLGRERRAISIFDQQERMASGAQPEQIKPQLRISKSVDRFGLYKLWKEIYKLFRSGVNKFESGVFNLAQTIPCRRKTPEMRFKCALRKGSDEVSVSSKVPISVGSEER